MESRHRPALLRDLDIVGVDEHAAWQRRIDRTGKRRHLKQHQGCSGHKRKGNFHWKSFRTHSYKPSRFLRLSPNRFVVNGPAAPLRSGSIQLCRATRGPRRRGVAEIGVPNQPPSSARNGVATADCKRRHRQRLRLRRIADCARHTTGERETQQSTAMRRSGRRQTHRLRVKFGG
jgi:hypothetical protein